jgi:hypothetical protein
MRLLTEFISLCNMLEQVHLLPGVPDTFAWRLTADQQYSASSAYRAMFIGCSRLLGARQLWKTSAPPQVKFFFWSEGGGWHIGDGAMASRRAANASFVIRRRKHWITSSLGAFIAGKCGQPV